MEDRTVRCTATRRCGFGGIRLIGRWIRCQSPLRVALGDFKSLPAAADSDGDGMPDEWELRFKLNPQDSSDGPHDNDKDG